MRKRVLDQFTKLRVALDAAEKTMTPEQKGAYKRMSSKSKRKWGRSTC